MAKGLESKEPITIGLERISLFRDLPSKTIEGLAKRCRWQRFGPNQIIIGYHEDSTDIFFVADGTVRVSIYSAAGKEVTFLDIHAGEFFGEFSAIDGQPRSANVLALTDAHVAILSRPVFWQIVEEHPEIAAFLLKHITAKARALSERIYEFSALAVRNRIHAELLRLARDSEQGDNTAVIAPAPTHAEIASRVGTHREAVSREMSNLAQKDLLRRDGRSLVIRDVATLNRMVHEILGE